MAERTKQAPSLDKAGRRLPTTNAFKTSSPVYCDRLERYIKSVRADSLEQIRQQFDKLAEPNWVFRGQSSSRWHLATSLERDATWQKLTFEDAESRLIRAFE